MQNLDLITQVVIRAIETAESWKNKKVPKTCQVINLYLNAARIIVKSEPEHTDAVRIQGAKVVKVIEAECEKDKAMSNLKGKAKEIKKIISSA